MRHINETYVRDSKATNKNKLYDAYVRFFRWATDRLGDRDGIVCLVTNNSFIDQIAFDGMRKHLLQDFTQIYHIDLHGNVRKNPKLSGTTHNVFGIQVGVGITVAIRNTKHPQKNLYYYRVPEYWKRAEKLAFLTKEKENIATIEWQELQPDERYTWITEGLRSEFETFIPIGSKEARAIRNGAEEETAIKTVFKIYSLGVRTNRDDWMYDFNREALVQKVTRFVETYNGEVDRWRRRGSETIAIDDFVIYDDTKIKWSESLKLNLQRHQYIHYSETKNRTSMYRPYCKRWLFFDRILNERVYQFPQIFPTSASELENIVILLKVGSEWPTFALATNVIPDLLPQGGSQCFPFLHLQRRRHQPPREHHRLVTRPIPGKVWPRRHKMGYLPLCLRHVASSAIPGTLC